MEPPLREERMTSTKNIQNVPIRIPVIVRNNFQLHSKKEFPDMSVSLKGLALD